MQHSFSYIFANSAHRHNFSPKTKELKFRKYMFYIILIHIYIRDIKHIDITCILHKGHLAVLLHVVLLAFPRNSVKSMMWLRGDW